MPRRFFAVAGKGERCYTGLNKQVVGAKPTVKEKEREESDTMKKIFQLGALAVAVCLCLGMFPHTAMASESAEPSAPPPGSQQTNAAYRTVGGNKYVIGIALDPDASAIVLNEGGQCIGQGVQGEPLPENPRSFLQNIQVCVGIRRQDALGGVYYEVDKTGAVQAVVKEMRLERVSGDPDTFSWEEGDSVLVKTEGFQREGTMAPLYFKQGYEGDFLVRAVVAITAQGETRVESVSLEVFTHNYEPEIYERPAGDTVEELNQFLEDTFSPGGPGQTPVTIRLAEGVYQGIIQLPERMLGANDLVIEGQSGTVVQGGIDLNGNNIYNIVGIDFQADSSQGEGRAVFGGNCALVMESTFQGYKVALDSQNALVNSARNVFWKNKVAARVDIEDAQALGINDWTGNVFLENGTAVQILSLHPNRSPYYFRVSESNFISNGTDFQVETPGTLYFYRNYFGEKAKQAPESVKDFLSQLDGAHTEKELKNLVKYKPPKVECHHSSTKIVTNPRWKAPLQYQLSSLLPETAQRTRLQAADSPEEPLKNALTVDWDFPTEIVNEDAATLPMDAAAFREEGEKEIQVVDSNGSLLAAWHFLPGEAEGSFQAGLAVAQEEESGPVTVEVQGGGVVETVETTLTIPCTFSQAVVTYNGRPISAQQAEGMLSFPVTGGGTYVVEEAVAPPPSSGGGATPPAPVVESGQQGGVSLSPSRPAQGQTVTLTVRPAPGYKVGSVTVTEQGGGALPVRGAGDGQYVFQQPAGQVTVKVAFVWDNPFADVSPDDWFYSALEYVAVNHLMEGTGGNAFQPSQTLNRAMAAQLFYNLEGKPTVTGDSTFTDVTSGHWAVDAITWAAQNDIVAGIGGDLYDPDSNVTREQFAQMLYNYAKYKGYDLTATGDLSQFPDAGSISSWAETALSWANGNDLINGHENGTIDPKGSTIRAQAASIMANFDQNVAK